MTLGIVAKRSTRKATRPRTEAGAYSAMNSAQATPMGVARMSAISDVTTVPNTYAAAPNFSVTGSQVLEARKPKP